MTQVKKRFSNLKKNEIFKFHGLIRSQAYVYLGKPRKVKLHQYSKCDVLLNPSKKIKQTPKNKFVYATQPSTILNKHK